MAPDLHQIKMVPKSVRKHRAIVKRFAVIVLLGIGIGVGIGIGFAASNTSMDTAETPLRQTGESLGQNDVSKRIQQEINAENIRENLRYLTSVPHVAGTPADLEGAEHIRDTWKAQGLDTVNIKAYKVLLSYPSSEKGKENKVQIINPRNGRTDFTSAMREDPFGEEELLQKGIPPPYNAYSATGDIQADMVYVNYGSFADLHYLTKFVSPPINLTGKILIARHGVVPRSKKALNAEIFGASALILYMDPADHYVGDDQGKPYPDGPWLTSTAAQRGSIHQDAGDPLTPHYPATERAFRVYENKTGLPKIPVHPISYSDAAVLIGNLRQHAEMPQNWTGKLNITYGIGPGFRDPYKDRKGRIVVHSERQLRWTYNVIGFIRGAIEPDRYVLVGNHRDAWGLGAVDPTSGTAALLEITRVFGKLKNNGWRPRRTLVFCSWGAEEFGLIGSVEWTEEYYHILAQRAVAYLNLDIAVAGDHVLSASASPHLIPVIFDATKKVPDPQPDGPRQTVYDTMKERRKHHVYPNPWVPVLRHAASDFYGFLQGVGVPCINVYYDSFPENWLYSLYHTSYETFRLVEEYIDPEFKYHQSIAAVVSEMLLSIGDEQLLPFDLSGYWEEVVMMWSRLLYHPWSEDIVEAGIHLDALQSAIVNFTRTADNFSRKLADVDKTSPLTLRTVNDQMMLLDRAFMIPAEHLPGQPLHRHVILSPQLSPFNKNYPRTFPGLVDTMVEVIYRPSDEAWRNVEKHISVLTYVIQSATDTLKDVTLWS